MRMRTKLGVTLTLTLLIGSMSILFGCGGGGSSATTPAGTTGAHGMISGTAVKGPISGATVTVYSITNGTMGMQLASGTTDSRGNFNMPIGDYAGTAMVQISGGTYFDEATGTVMPMAPGDVMTAVMTSLSSGSTVTGIQVTPLTSMAQAMANGMTGGMIDANITAANTAIGNYFMVNDIVHTQPMNPLVAGSGVAASQDMKNYGIAIAAISQSAKDMGMTSSSSMVTAMMNDASDGIMNGMMGNTPVMMGGMMGGSSMMSPTAGTSGLATEMATFITSTWNKSGVTTTDMLALMNKLASSATGTIQSSGGGMPMSGMVSGSVFNGTMGNATVTAYAVSNGAMGAQLASGPTNSMGGFSLSLGAYSGSVMIRTGGGSYNNLATDTTLSMLGGDGMTAVIPTIASGATVTGIQVTPLTSMAQARAQAMAGGMIGANITAANTAVGSYFMVSDIIYTQPMNAAVSGSGGTATTDSKNYGAAIAAMSQYAATIGMTDPAALITNMMEDASDGVMNGMMGSTRITMGGMGGGMMGGGTMMQSTAGTSGLANAMTTFMGSAVNKSGLSAADMQTLINKLTSSNGTL